MGTVSAVFNGDAVGYSLTGKLGLRRDGAGTLTLAPGGTKPGDWQLTGTLAYEDSDVEVLAANRTLTEADNGMTFIVNAVDLVATLPATALGLWFRFIVMAPSATTGFSISPVAADSINEGTDDKDLINTAATDAIGNSAFVVANGTTGWIATVTGTWAAEA